MSTVRLIATKPYAYAGRSLKVGDAFDASEAHAKVLTMMGSAKAAPTDRYHTKVIEAPASDERPAVTKRRTYRKRDLVAET